MQLLENSENLATVAPLAAKEHNIECKSALQTKLIAIQPKQVVLVEVFRLRLGPVLDSKDVVCLETLE